MRSKDAFGRCFAGGGGNITVKKCEQYEEYFNEYGAAPQGVGWGVNGGKNAIRYRNFLDIVSRFPVKGRATILDVGCGYGELLRLLRENQLPVEYSGIDVAGGMLRHAREKFGAAATFYEGDFCDFASKTSERFDYVVCNGILTDMPKGCSRFEMGQFARRIIRSMFVLAKVGIAFNHMSDQADFFADHLFHRSPVEVLAWCLDELSPIVELRHSLPRYEFTVYVGKPEHSA